MHSFLGLVQNVDVRIYYWLSQFHSDWLLNQIASHIEANTLMKSGVLIAAYWYFWFREGEGKQKRRSTILTILVGTLVGLFVARMIATFAPFRVRPMLDTSLRQNPFPGLIEPGFVGWSGFPSDHAAYLGALGFGLIRLSRRLKVPVLLYLALWVCLPRLYLGVHYASDVLVGAIIGYAAIAVAVHSEVLREHFANPVLAFMEAKPQVFYAVAFLVLFELSTMFSDAVGPARDFLHALSAIRHEKAAEVTLLCALAALMFLLVRRLTQHRPLPDPGPEIPLKARGARA